MLIFVILCVVTAAIYVLGTFYQAKYLVSGSPKQEMFICPRGHGALPPGGVMQIDIGEYQFDVDGAPAPSGQKVPYCALCYEERIAEAKKNYKAKE